LSLYRGFIFSYQQFKKYYSFISLADFESYKKMYDMVGNPADYGGVSIDITVEDEDDIDYESLRPYNTILNDQFTSDGTVPFPSYFSDTD